MPSVNATKSANFILTMQAIRGEFAAAAVTL
jgi:hypothetical protein